MSSFFRTVLIFPDMSSVSRLKLSSGRNV
jgi:hypothetical protein